MIEPPNKCTIVCLDNPALSVTAQFRPKEISIDRSVPWNKHKNPKGNMPMLEFTSAENRTLSMELFFDGFEQGINVHAAYILRLEQMTMIPEGATDEKKHPPRIMIVWAPAFPPFKGVIESLGIKYTMFLPNGTPVRATCTLKVKEVDQVQLSGTGEGGGAGAGGGGGGGGAGGGGI